MPDLLDLSKMDTVVVDGPYGFRRLERYWKEPDSDFWDDLWKRTDPSSYWVRAAKGDALGDYRELYLSNLKKGSRVLEAGCGVGQVVISLRARGFDCYGLDFADKTIANLKAVFPDAPFHVGDIHNVPFGDGFFDAYISLGVIEHFQSGQLRMVEEAGRVVRSGGHIFLSVPALNGYRQLRTHFKWWKSSSNLPFFESCISEEELTFLLDKSGFDFMGSTYTNPVMTFAQETYLRSAYRVIEDVRYVRGAVDRTLNMFLPDNWFGHMVMVVGRKR